MGNTPGKEGEQEEIDHPKEPSNLPRLQYSESSFYYEPQLPSEEGENTQIQQESLSPADRPRSPSTSLPLPSPPPSSPLPPLPPAPNQSSSSLFATDPQSPSAALSPTSSLSPSSSLNLSFSASQLNQPRIPTIFTWPYGGETVQLTGTWNNWKLRIPLLQSEQEFTLICGLPPGTYQYKFIVDGRWEFDPRQPLVTDPLGNVNNVITVDLPPKVRSYHRLSDSPPGSYGAFPVPETYFSSSPQPLPPHLNQILLNTQIDNNDPTVLPTPQHIILNRVYFCQDDSREFEEKVKKFYGGNDNDTRNERLSRNSIDDESLNLFRLETLISSPSPQKTIENSINENEYERKELDNTHTKGEICNSQTPTESPQSNSRPLTPSSESLNTKVTKPMTPTSTTTSISMTPPSTTTPKENSNPNVSTTKESPLNQLEESNSQDLSSDSPSQEKTPPNRLRNFIKFESTTADERVAETEEDLRRLASAIVPYSLKSDQVQVMGLTHRFRRKYVTFIFYKPVSETSPNPQNSDGLQYSQSGSMTDSSSSSPYSSLSNSYSFPE